MTPDNPNPLEVWKAAFKAWYDNDSRWSVAQAAAATIIAQHYAPVIAENEALRAEVARLTRSLQQHTDALAQLGTKP